jgi:Domain of unknown function (DUF6916)
MTAAVVPSRNKASPDPERKSVYEQITRNFRDINVTIETLTIDSLRPRLNESFRLLASNVSLDLRLIEVQDLGDGVHRRAFSLIFSGPAESAVPQATYRLDNPATGPLDIFLVPLGPEKGVFRYEAIFT